MANKFSRSDSGVFELFGPGGKGGAEIPADDGLTTIRASVRELERIAVKLRLAGDRHVSESIDLRVLSLLEEKITRKIMAKSRREQLPKGNAPA
jgi:hypothetical protein